MTYCPDPPENKEDRSLIGCLTIIGIGMLVVGSAMAFGGYGLMASGGALLALCAWRTMR